MTLQSLENGIQSKCLSMTILWDLAIMDLLITWTNFWKPWLHTKFLKCMYCNKQVHIIINKSPLCHSVHNNIMRV